MVARSRGVSFSSQVAYQQLVPDPGFMCRAFDALGEVAAWLGFENEEVYNRACKYDQSRVRQLLAEAK
jgi:hypothetical protein